MKTKITSSLLLVAAGLLAGAGSAQAADLGALAPGGPVNNQFSFTGNLAFQFFNPSGPPITIDPITGLPSGFTGDEYYKVDFRPPSDINVAGQQLNIPDFPATPLGPVQDPYFIKSGNTYTVPNNAQVIDGIYVYGAQTTATGAASQFFSPSPTDTKFGLIQDTLLAGQLITVDYPTMPRLLTMDPPSRTLSPTYTSAGDIPAARTLGVMNGPDTFHLTRSFPVSVTQDPFNPNNSRLQLSVEGMYMCGNQALNNPITGFCYNGRGTFVLPFVGQTSSQVFQEIYSGNLVTKEFSANFDISEKVPEPSSLAGLVAVLGSTLALRKHKKADKE